MNKKILAGVAGLVAAAGLASGGTFANWTDNYTDGPNNVGAGHIKLDVAHPSAATQFDKMNLIPGGEADYEFVVTSMESNANPGYLNTYMPKGDLTATINNLKGTEDGKTSQSEEDAQGTVVPGTDSDGSVNQYGQFDDQANLVVNVYQKGAAGTRCGTEPLASSQQFNLRSIADTPIELLGGTNANSIDAGEGVCVRMAIQLPFASATNASQGDSASFNARFDLTQTH